MFFLIVNGFSKEFGDSGESMSPSSSTLRSPLPFMADGDVDASLMATSEPLAEVCVDCCAPRKVPDGPLTDSAHAVGNCGSDLGASKTILCGDALG